MGMAESFRDLNATIQLARESRESTRMKSKITARTHWRVVVSYLERFLLFQSEIRVCSRHSRAVDASLA
jgi:hypothetical protein